MSPMFTIAKFYVPQEAVCTEKRTGGHLVYNILPNGTCILFRSLCLLYIAIQLKVCNDAIVNFLCAMKPDLLTPL